MGTQEDHTEDRAAGQLQHLQEHSAVVSSWKLIVPPAARRLCEVAA